VKPISYNQLGPVTAIGLGYSVSGPPSAWAIGTTYALAATVSYGGNIFASRQGGNVGNNPVTSPLWVQIDATYGIPVGALYARLQAETKPIRYTEDGSTPTASLGMLLDISGAGADNSILVGQGNNPLSNIQLIQTAGTALLDVTFYRD
jgi:hypothetical protein